MPRNKSSRVLIATSARGSVPPWLRWRPVSYIIHRRRTTRLLCICTTQCSSCYYRIDRLRCFWNRTQWSKWTWAWSLHLSSLLTRMQHSVPFTCLLPITENVDPIFQFPRHLRHLSLLHLVHESAADRTEILVFGRFLQDIWVHFHSIEQLS